MENKPPILDKIAKIDSILDYVYDNNYSKKHVCSSLFMLSSFYSYIVKNKKVPTTEEWFNEAISYLKISAPSKKHFEETRNHIQKYLGSYVHIFVTWDKWLDDNLAVSNKECLDELEKLCILYIDGINDKQIIH